MYKRLASSCIPRTSFFLFGPRQVGKSTFLQQLHPAWSLDLLDPALQLEYSKDPLTLKRTIAAIKQPGLIVIDEVQRVPALLDVVQLMMQERPELRFALSGSSARKIKRGAANLLGGRAAVRNIFPLSYAELGDDFELERVLAYGSLPKIYTLASDGDSPSAQDLLKSYVVTYLNEEIKAEAIVRNLQGFQNFLDVAAAQFSEQVNFSKVEKDCRISHAAVRDYYSILEDTLIGFFLQPCLRSRRKRMSHAPKFYFFDNGVTRAISGLHRSAISPIERGRLVEQWFIQEVVRLNSYRQKEWGLSFWRTSHGAEVDLVLERGREILCAIEIKSGRTISEADLSGIKSLREVFPKVPCFVASLAETPQKFGDVEVMPALTLLNRLAEAF